MARIQTSDLIGPALDWAVAVAAGEQSPQLGIGGSCVVAHGHTLHWYCPSAEWAHGGPIIDREHISTNYDASGRWSQGWRAFSNSHPVMLGETALIAAMVDGSSMFFTMEGDNHGESDAEECPYCGGSGDAADCRPATSSDAPEMPDWAELRRLAEAATPQDFDSAAARPDADGQIECPICYGEGYLELEGDYCNYDGHALGVQFYGIGKHHGAAEAYYRAARPATVLALLDQLAERDRQWQARLDAAQEDAARYRWLRNEAWGGDMLRHKYPHVVEFGAGLSPSSVTELAEEALDAAIDAAIAQE
ncbi:phage protein NinX family protein [Chitiniphilus shinanonensis]|uniref:phage protein NinX family protein n=1 Tax=Chitiniphilus shinanonensis TaxID=553088 RepID=UPI0030560E85